MTSSDNETWQPEPPVLLPPWHTPGAGEAAGAGPPVRDGRGAAGRQRARPAEGRDPGVPARPAGRARLLRHHRARRAGRPGPRRLRVLHGQRGAGPRLDVDGQHPGPLPGAGDGGAPTPTAGTSCWPAARAATGSARSRSPSPTPAPTWPGSRPAPSSTATSGWSPGASAGAATPRPPTSSRCSCASASRRRGSRARPGWSTCCWRRSGASSPRG